MRARAHRVIAHLRRQWMGALALFLVLSGGVAYAVNTVFSTDIVDGEVKAADIGTSAVRSPDIGNDQVTSADVRDDTLVNGGLTSADIAADALTDADLASSAQFNGATAGGALTGGYPSPFIATGAVDSAAVQNNREGAGGLFSIDIANDGCRECGLLGEDIAEDTLTGDDISETTLSGVNADTLDGAGLCRTDGVLTLPGGTVADPPNTQQLCAEGPLSIQAYCDRTTASGVHVVGARLQIDTSTDDSFYFDPTAADLDFDDAEGFRPMIYAEGTSTSPSRMAGGAFGVGASDGSQLSGIGIAKAFRRSKLEDPDICWFVLNATN